MTKKNKSNPVCLVKGRQIPWGIPDVEYPWVGGNYYQLDEMLRFGNWGFLEEIMRNLRDSVKDKDAGMMHMRDLHDFARKQNDVDHPSSILIFVLDQDFSDEFRRDPISTAAGISLEFVENTCETETAIARQSPTFEFEIGGLNAYGTVFEMTRVSGGDWIRSLAVVPLGESGTHFFLMNAPKSKFEKRSVEFEAILKRLQYDPRVVKKATS